jgi:hypothetical protein
VSPRPYRRRLPPLRLERIGVSGWLWFVAAILAIVLIVLYFA